jgi:hypothetical protein
VEYNGRFALTESDLTRRFLVQAAAATKTTAGAPYTNDGYIEVVINGTAVKRLFGSEHGDGAPRWAC